MADWTGNRHSMAGCIGAIGHSSEEREANDYYATEPKAAELLLQLEHFNENIWECACGEGHSAKVFAEQGHNVLATDLIDRGYGTGGVDFLQLSEKYNGDIVTNPPYKYAQEFIEKALELVEDGAKVAMFLRLQFLEGKGRRKLYADNPPKVIYVSSARLRCGKNAVFSGANMSAYAWYVWEKGYKGDTIVRWFN